MSGTVNIRRDVKDAFYRYKMPKIQSKIEGKGNGIKTVVSNMVEVAKALNRPPAYVTKFFGNEVGSIVHCDDKTGRYIVNGAHDAEKLATLLDSFINKFVLCPACENPETDLSIQGRDMIIYRQCKACGHSATVDMGHKLVTFIQKNPPKRKNEGEGAAATEGGDVEAKEMEGEEENEQGMVAPDNLNDFDNVTTSKLSDDWANEKNAVEEFGDWLNTSTKDDDIINFIEDRMVASDKAVAIAVQVLLEPSQTATISANFTQRTNLFNKLVGTEKEQKAFLGGLERLLTIRSDLLKYLPGLLQAAYTADIIEDEAILSWYERPSKRYQIDKAAAKRVREVAKPFVDWLQQEDSEEESDAGDE